MFPQSSSSAMGRGTTTEAMPCSYRSATAANSRLEVTQEDIDDLFGGAKVKADVMLSLEKCTFLHRIPLPPPVVPLAQAHKDFRRECILLNDLAFIPDKSNELRGQAFALTLDVLLNRFAQRQDVFDKSQFSTTGMIRDVILQRACRTSAGADSFFAVQKMLCVEGTCLTQKDINESPPIHVDVFLAQVPSDLLNDEFKPPSLCCRIEVSNSFALFDVEVVDELTGDSRSDPPSWLDVEAVVVDESDFRSGSHTRRLHLVVTCPATGVTYASSDERIVLRPSAAVPSFSASALGPRKVLRDLSQWFSGLSAVPPRNFQSEGLIDMDEDRSSSRSNSSLQRFRSHSTDLSKPSTVSSKY